LEDLDINLGMDTTSVFHIFRKDLNGQVPLAEMLTTMMRLRGGTSKADFIGPSVMIGGLGDDLQRDIRKVQEMVLSSHKVMQGCQRQVRELTEKRWAAAVEL